ncbi:hypothetical protein SprV_0802588900 [Sparganum proliferum]
MVRPHTYVAMGAILTRAPRSQYRRVFEVFACRNRMPRGTRSGKTPQATPKNTKKTASATPSSADVKPAAAAAAAEASPSPARTRSRVSAAAEADSVTPKRALRKRDISKAELTQSSSPETSKTAATTSKRRRMSPQPEQQDPNPQPTPPPRPAEEEEKKTEEQGQTAPAASDTLQTPARSTRSGSRKRRGAPSKSETSPATADSPDLPSRDPSSKKPRTSEEPTSTLMSPTVVVSPLATPASKTGADNAGCGTTTLPQSELFPTVRLTPMAELKEEGGQGAVEKEPSTRPDCDRSISFNPPATSKSRPAPNQTASPTEGMGDTVAGTDGDGEVQEGAASATATGSATKLPPSPPSEPKPPTKEELLTLQRRQLLQHLDHYDLSDAMSTSSLLANWPEVDAKPTAVSATSPPDAVKPSQRIWVLERSNTDSRATSQEGSRDTPSSPVATVNGTPEVQATKQQLLTAASPASDSITTLDSFCVGSFTMSTPQVDEPNSPTDEEDRLLVEVDTIRPDVFCLRNAHPSEATSRLRPELMRRGYQSSACPEGPAFANPSFIFYNRDIFTEVSFHHRPVQATARKLAYRSAYPQSWRDSLQQAISTTASLLDLEAGSKERAGEAADTGPELLVSVLRHKRTGSLLLVGCLTDQPGADGKDGGFLSSPSKIYSSNCSDTTVAAAAATSSSNSSSSSVCNTSSSNSVCNTVSCTNLLSSISSSNSVSRTNPLSSSGSTTVNSGAYNNPAQTNTNCLSTAWNHIPYVYCPTGAPTTTVSVARPGCLYSSLFSASGEWCPPTFKCRPDLAAMNAAGAFWVLQDIWEEEVVASSCVDLHNGLPNPVCGSLQNGFAAAGEQTVTTTPSPPFRWVLCGNLDAASTSPAYQICRDGYPSDDSIARLKVVRNVHLSGHDYLDSTSLIDLLWHAFQHPCTDVSSCYSSVLGREPPFTRFMLPPVANAGLHLRNCVDYIFCSSSTLHPRAVFMPPCRAVVSAASTAGPPRPPSSRPLAQPETLKWPGCA